MSEVDESARLHCALVADFSPVADFRLESKPIRLLCLVANKRTGNS